MQSSAILIMAHPGHELVLHHWMQIARPVVFALTDGSGSSGSSRLRRSIDIIERAGATIGGEFGRHADGFWYSSILARDIGPFVETTQTIIEACKNSVPKVVVSDSVQYCNPIHDLCAVIGHCVTSTLSAHSGSSLIHLQYSIEGKVRPQTISQRFILDSEALRQKQLALSSYLELQHDIERIAAGQPDFKIDEEALFVAPGIDMWPQKLNERPIYEVYGQQRCETGLYSELITYQKHVRPVAMALFDCFAAGGKDYRSNSHVSR